MDQGNESQLFFEKNGYLIVPDVFDQEKILYARSIFENAFQQRSWQRLEADSEEIMNCIYDHFPELANIFFTPKYFAAVRQILGNDIVFVPEPAIHRNRFFNWHKDTTSQEAAGMAYQHQPEEMLIQAAIYFQENTEYGGGLTVIPGTQYNHDRFVNQYYPSPGLNFFNKFQKLFGLSIFQKLDRNPTLLNLQTKPGDLLLFDLRVDHRSTFPAKGLKRKEDKFALFNTFGASNSYIRQYQDYLRSRPEPYYRLLSASKVNPILSKIASEHNVEIYF